MSLTITSFFQFSSQMLQGTIIIILSLTATIKAEELGVFFKIEENHFLLDGNPIWDEKVDSLMSCSQTCARRADCRSANYIQSNGACSLLGNRQTQHAKKLLRRQGSFYLEKVCYQYVIGIWNHITEKAKGSDALSAFLGLFSILIFFIIIFICPNNLNSIYS